MVGSVVGGRVGDQLGVGHEDGLDDPQAGGPQRPAGLGDLDHGVGDLGDLGLGGAVGQHDLGLDPVGGSRKRRVSSGYSVDTRTPAGRSATDWAGESSPTASTTLIGRAVALLVVQLAER